MDHEPFRQPESAGTLDLKDDQVPSFSSVGTVARRVDIVAPGAHIASTRVPGSYVDLNYGAAAGVSSTLIKGSGTSQAAAVVSGAAALVIQQRPGITPQQLKLLLMKTATPLGSESPDAQGKGELNLARTFGAATPPLALPTGVPSSGLGSIASARGTSVVRLNGVPLVGNVDIFGKGLVVRQLTGLAPGLVRWVGGTFNGTQWTGNTWSASTWSGSTWSASTWSASTWSGSTWSASTWSASTWSGSTWSGNTWSSASWD
ncbi:MAG: S8 family serine peptidase [Chloroflexi bacterium]|nr:S8 family serine peptidase [Chloroflexota bacterium]